MVIICITLGHLKNYRQTTVKQGFDKTLLKDKGKHIKQTLRLIFLLLLAEDLSIRLLLPAQFDFSGHSFVIQPLFELRHKKISRISLKDNFSLNTLDQILHPFSHLPGSSVFGAPCFTLIFSYLYLFICIYICLDGSVLIQVFSTMMACKCLLCVLYIQVALS